MPYNSVINRADVAGIIPVEYSTELIGAVAEASYCMRLGRRLRDMPGYQRVMPVMSALATAYFVGTGADTGLVQTSEVNWADVNLYAEDLAVLVPIPTNVLDDSSIPIWSEVRPELVTALGVAIDNAVLYGTNKPTTWPDSIITDCDTAVHNVSLAAADDLYDAILGDDQMFSLIEQDGYMVNGAIAHPQMRGLLRNCRDSDGNPIFNKDPATPMQWMLDGSPLYFPTNGVPTTTYKMVAGDWSQLVYSMRKDIDFEVYSEGIIQDAAGNIVYNLMQQRMAAIMVVMRVGFQLPNPINRVNTTAATRYPFAYLTT
jgi:HK97 family phage major capsid protein